MRTLLLIPMMLLLQGCPTALIYVGYLKTTTDVVQTLADEQTITDIIISEITDEDCKTANIFDNKDYCLEKKEQK